VIETSSTDEVPREAIQIVNLGNSVIDNGNGSSPAPGVSEAPPTFVAHSHHRTASRTENSASRTDYSASRTYHYRLVDTHHHVRPGVPILHLTSNLHLTRPRPSQSHRGSIEAYQASTLTPRTPTQQTPITPIQHTLAPPAVGPVGMPDLAGRSGGSNSGGGGGW
jgi:hypothetical protein